MTVITRFAPSPTGYLHIGGARTALFNFLYAKAKDGKFLLRIEDTDKARSTVPAIEAIIKGLKWLEIDWDGEAVIQSEREKRHREVAYQLLKEGKAYRCYYSQEELENMRQISHKDSFYNEWRDGSKTPPADIKPTIRIKSPEYGKILIEDVIQGNIEIDSEELDDFVILRSDETPTYMLAVVVDDHDMGVTHIIRGDDHLTNAARQNVIYQALGWQIPYYTHIALIHGEDGSKLSKRHGALGIEAYQEMGYLPEAVCNYLLRLGWSHGNDEIISRAEAIKWFDIRDLGKSPSRIDFKKLDNLNFYYLKIMPTHLLLQNLKPFITKLAPNIDKKGFEILERALPSLTQRSKTLVEMANKALFYVMEGGELITDEAKSHLNEEYSMLLEYFIENFSTHEEWNKETIMEKSKEMAEKKSLKLHELMQVPRIALTGSLTSPGVGEIMEIFGKTLTIKRLKSFSEDFFAKNAQ